MTETTRKTNNILSALETEGDPDDLDVQIENLEACLKAAATIHLMIKEIEPEKSKVRALAWEANNAMFSLIAKWEKNT